MAPRTASATPRTTRAAARAQLPALDARVSSAYGAPGPAQINAQVRAGENDFEGAIGAGRKRQTRGRRATEEPEVPAEDPVHDATPAEVPVFVGETVDPVPVVAPVAQPAQQAYLPTKAVIFVCLFAALHAFLYAFALRGPLPAAWVETRSRIIAKALFDGRPEEWNPVMQSAANWLFRERLTKVENAVDDLRRRTGLLEEGLDAITGALPDYLVVRRTDDGFAIPDAFWAAMAEQMSRGGSDGGAALWDAFLENNQARVETLFNRIAAGDDVPAGEIPQSIVTRERFTDLIHQNNAQMQQNFGNLLHDTQREILSRAEKIAHEVSEDTIKKSPTYQLASHQFRSLGYANYMTNVQKALAEINWLSAGIGARVDPKLTSTTMNKNSGWIPWAWTKVMGYEPLPPIAALQEWSEAGQCWCAAPSPMGRAQLTAMMPEKIYPETLVVEHTPASGTLDIAAAPRDLELWAELPTGKEAKKMAKAIKDLVPPTDSNRCGTPPGPKFVCIGTGTYDIHFSNWVQTFPTFVDTAALGLSTDKISVRAKSNWGQQWTCLYRLRVTGKSVKSTLAEKGES